MLAGSSLGAAQQPTPPPDTTTRPAIKPVKLPVSPLDTVMARDSADAAPDTSKLDARERRRLRLIADSIKAPTAQAERPPLTDDRWLWTGEALRSTGAVTLADLLARIPGTAEFRANWIPAPQFIAYNGDVGRVRLFLDGVELDAIDPRNGGVLDLALMPLWQLEEVAVERTAGELRVHMRTWRVDRTTPRTRTDVTSGSEGTNLYRGFFGKRLHNGTAIQLAAQQYSSISQRTGGDGSSLQVFGRLGWARKNWSADVTWNRASVDRNGTTRFPQYPSRTVTDAVPVFKGPASSAYGRIAWGDPDAPSAPWVQLLASTQGVRDESDTVRVDSVYAADSSRRRVDVSTFARSRSQYVLAAGASRWGVKASATTRMRIHDGQRDVSPSARLAYQRGFVALTAFGETRGADSTRRLDAGVRVTPWRWLEFQGAFGSYAPSDAPAGGPSFTASRAEIATTWRGRRFSAGVMTRGLTRVAAPTVLDSILHPATTEAAKGFVAAIRGRIYRSIALDISAVDWATAGPYRPQLEVQSRLVLDTSWPGRFPRGNFHYLAEIYHQHRTPMFFPSSAGGVGLSTAPIDILSARMEIRIVSGTVFWEGRNLFGKIYDTAPGYVMPRAQQYYGLRWEFWN